ncbi:unnamed protein product, partial [marine sediment metagenome]
AGYNGVAWTATKLGWRLQVLWRGDQAKFYCRAGRIGEDDVREARLFDYPHEVVEWMGRWFTQLAQAKV